MVLDSPSRLRFYTSMTQRDTLSSYTHALRSIRIKKKDVEGNKKFWKQYVKLCREKAKCHDVCMRTLDRALYKFSQSGAAFALKKITNEMLFLELKRRGSNLSRLQLDENTGKIVKIR